MENVTPLFEWLIFPWVIWGGVLSRTTSLMNGEAQEGAPGTDLGVVLLQISSVDRRHGPFSFMVDELVCTSLVHFLNDIRTIPIW